MKNITSRIVLFINVMIESSVYKRMLIVDQDQLILVDQDQLILLDQDQLILVDTTTDAVMKKYSM